jgi:type II secretory pathway pseudopilin PulG
MRHFRLNWLDILIVVSILALLVAIIVPSMGRAREGSRSICEMNLRSLGITFKMYATDYGGHWPASNATLESLCQQTAETRDALVARMGGNGTRSPASTQRVFYCPANTDQNRTNLWDHDGISTWGYVLLNDRGPAGTLLPTTFPAHKSPLHYVCNPAKEKSPSQTIFALDTIVSDTATAPLNFAPKGPSVEFPSNHLVRGQVAWVKVLFADGHVTRNPFDPNTATPVQQPTGTYLWFPNP